MRIIGFPEHAETILPGRDGQNVEPVHGTGEREAAAPDSAMVRCPGCNRLAAIHTVTDVADVLHRKGLQRDELSPWVCRGFVARARWPA